MTCAKLSSNSDCSAHEADGHCQLCGPLRVGKGFLHVAGLASAAMCSAIKANANGAKLKPVLETIENALRADQPSLSRRNEWRRRALTNGDPVPAITARVSYHCRPISNCRAPEGFRLMLNDKQGRRRYHAQNPSGPCQPLPSGGRGRRDSI